MEFKSLFFTLPYYTKVSTFCSNTSNSIQVTIQILPGILYIRIFKNVVCHTEKPISFEIY